MLKPLAIRIILYALVVFILLYSLLSYFVLATDTNTSNQDINLLDKNPQFIYGSKIENKENLAFQLDEYGEAAILFNLKQLQAEDIPALSYQISNLPKNYQALLVWQLREQQEIYETKLLQATGSQQLILLSNIDAWRGEISQLGLSFRPQDHLGIPVPNRTEIQIQSLQMRTPSYFRDSLTLMQYWLAYNPLNYRSINHLSLDKSLPYYAQLQSFAILWLLSFSLLLYVKFKRLSFLPLFLTSWLFIAFFNTVNSSKQTQWATTTHDRKNTTLPDDNLLKIAKQVKALLGLNNNRINKIKTNKVLVLSSDKYQRSRIIYHLLPVNSSFLDTNIEKDTKSIVRNGDFILSISLNNDHVRPQNGQLILNDLRLKVKEVAKSQNFSIMEVVK